MNKYKNFLYNCKIIEEYYEYLIYLTNNHNFVGATNEWIIDNYYIIAEIKSSLNKILKENYKIKNVIKRNDKLYQTLVKAYEENNFSLGIETIVKKLQDIQINKNDYLDYDSIEVVPILLSFILIDRLKKLCLSRKNIEFEKQKVHHLVKELELGLKNNASLCLSDYITIDKDVANNPEIIEQLNDCLKELGSMSNDIFIQLDKMLEEQDLSLKELINNANKVSINNNILIANIFNSLRLILKIKTPELFDKASKTEQVLKKDEWYSNMTSETKGLYRTTITKNRKNISEYDYACMLLEKSKQSGNHIGFYLFKQPNYKLRSKTYITLIVLLTLLISGLLSLITLDYFLLAFIILIVPISEFVIQVLNRILIKLYPCNPLPKMDFSKGIDEENATIVVIPTIIKDTKKIDKMYELLEKYYLANNSENLYFSLLADCVESKDEIIDMDSVIGSYGIEVSNTLNKKYGRNIFGFMYRKRVFNSGEGKFLGYERKRGALIHFNKLLLNQFNTIEKDKYIYVENISDIKQKIKYVITIDVDTELVLNTALSLIGVMAHPLNKPILNKNKTKVISGYGIIQPRVNVDIESTNKSIYSQLMAGIGGFDVYSSIVPNFYQDVFGEGSFVGKGIYDLQVFDDILSNAFPDNLILSHDLLEGNYLRCGFASDIELIDDFPSEFLTESSRQHRWTRGDVQILGWLKNKVKTKQQITVKNPLNLIERFKIFDNLRRIWVNPCMLLLIILSFICGNPLWSFLIVLTIISLPLVYYTKELLHRQNKKLFTFKYYNKLLFGIFSVLYRILVNFITIPYYSYLYLNALIKALYRMNISHKNLLNWVTSEDASKMAKKDLKAYIYKFGFNFIVSIVIVILAVISSPKDLIVAIPISLSFALAPVILWSFSKTEDVALGGLNEKQNEDIREMAFRTWNYFYKLLIPENNYLIPDNIQLNREVKEDYKTSPTDIGMSIIAVISANSLNFITDEESHKLIANIIATVDKLEKWNGHLYNWYNIKSLSKIVPYEVSSVDSGNFAASLVVAKEYCLKKGYIDLFRRISILFDNMDFSKLYTDHDVFSIAYSANTNSLSGYNYNNFASEARILSFVSIMKGDVPSKHWLCLDKTLTKYKKHKGVVSWSGTSFEYFMPLIFMRTYPNTLLDESYFFAKFCQESYIKEIDNKMPWGISESAYDELDDGLNYKYKAFATPYLKVIDEKDERLVISPYASILTITRDPVGVYNNLKLFKKMNMYNELGFYESYDYTTGNKVLSYYAHHQGMILASLTNYLKDNIIQDYFHSDLRTQAFEILLKEKVQFNPVIDMKVVGYKKYDYEREKIANDIREYNYISDTPQLSVLSNSHYTVLINDRGNGFSRYNTIQLNRYRKITDQQYGIYMYIKDLDTNKAWSNTFAPMNVKPDKYNVVFANDRIKFSRTDGDIVTNTEIIVTQMHSAEIRKITIKNNSDALKRLELTSYTEAIIVENIEDINHRTFKSLFVSSKYDEDLEALIIRRRNNSKKTSNYMFAKLVTDKQKNDITYETERDRFIGRGNNTYNPIMLDKPLSNIAGTNIDPIISLRTSIEIEPNKEVTIYYVGGFSKSLEGVQDTIKAYSNVRNIEEAYNYATLSNNELTKLLNIDGYDIRTYNIMLNYLYQTSRHFINDERKRLLSQNELNQTGLWKFGISGDRPIILVDIHSGEAYTLAKDVIRAYEYFKSKGIYIDLVIINGEADEYKDIVKKEVEQEIFRMNKLFDFSATPGNIYLLSIGDISWSELVLLNMVARLSFHSETDSSLEEAINRMHLDNKIIDFPKLVYEKTILLQYNFNKLKAFNGYGGFDKTGKEYIITNPNTPVIWSNVLANPNFGSIVTNNECGFTYANNSQMFKLTTWTNDIVVNDKSEGISIDGKEVQTGICKHGFGYTTFSRIGEEYALETKQFVACNDKVKFYLNKLTNTSSKKHKFHITFWIKPTLGPNEEKSSRYLLTEYLENLNSVTIRNVYNINFSKEMLFMSSTLPITEISTDRIIYKSISVDVWLEPNETKEFSFMLGSSKDNNDLEKTLQKYSITSNVREEYYLSTNMWKEILGTIKVKTPDFAFDTMMNGWYLYQTISSRLYAKAGFYQVGGAYGYRDQLQDAMNICEILPDITRKQILINASHQFREGDVLHWWHTINHFGLRSRYMDDFLWLVYATIRYINVTNDYKILDEEVCFVEGELLKDNEEERGMNFTYSNDTKTLFEHLLLSINRTMNNIGKNGLPLMGGGDWNDGMNKVGIGGQGTSVWLGFFAYKIISEFVELCEKLERTIDFYYYEKFLYNLKQALNNNAWDGEYYIRAFFDNGQRLGSKANDECEIDLISQSFSILSEVIPQERINSVINAVEEHLVDKKLKIIKLLTPPFKEVKNVPGYIMDYPKGIRENGGQYTHSAAWYIMALLKTGYIDRAYQYYQMINPINRTLTLEEVGIYRAEPYVIAADIYSNFQYPARAGWTWYTGSAGWFYNIGLTGILGFNKKGNILRIEPKTPSSWKEFEIEYKYIDTLYKIKVRTNEKNPSIMVDGEKIKQDSIKLKNDKRIHAVIVNIKGGQND